MHKHEHYLQRLLSASPLVYFFVYSLCFGLVLWLIGSYVIHMPLVWWMIIAQAVAYGGVMTLITWLSQRRTNAALGKLQPDIEQRMELAKALRTAKMPRDPALREALPGYLDQVDKQNRRIRIIGPIEFGLFAVLALYLRYRSDNPVWFAFTGLLLGFAIFCYYQPAEVLARSSVLRKKLQRAAKRTTSD